jgi:hypothetical protein
MHEMAGNFSFIIIIFTHKMLTQTTLFKITTVHKIVNVEGQGDKYHWLNMAFGMAVDVPELSKCIFCHETKRKEQHFTKCNFHLLIRLLSGILCRKDHLTLALG